MKIQYTLKGGSILSVDKNYLYVFRLNNSTIQVEHVPLPSPENTTNIEISYDIRGRSLLSVDENCIYIIDEDSQFLAADQFSGEILHKTQIKSLCASNIVQTNEDLYVLSILPTKTDKLRFSTYFVTRISKIDFSVTKGSFLLGKPNRSLVRENDCLYLSDQAQLVCIDSKLNKKWSSRLKAKSSNPIVHSEEYIILSSQEGALQCFSLSGENKFNIQYPKSMCSPILVNKEVFWNTENTTYKVDIESVSIRSSKWQEKLEAPLKNTTCMAYFDGDIIYGNMNGELFVKGKSHKIGKDPILLLQENNKNILCETSTEVHLFGDI